MLQFFLNPLMLTGLAGITLPVIAHLLSKRKFDVVHWGAMQFLNPSRRTRRKLRLEELLLLLVRILMISLIALAVARPWISSGLLTGYQSAGSRDVVLVIDGSNSMSRTDGLTSLHQKAIQTAKELLTTLKHGDTVAIVDVRDRPIRILSSPLQDMAVVEEFLDNLPPPSGAGNLHRACEEAVGILSRCSNGSREIIVLTDRQRIGWAAGNDALWRRFDEVLRFPGVTPRMWVLDVGAGLDAMRSNIAVGTLEVSRSLAVPDFPVSLRIPVRNTGKTAVDVPLRIEMNGQRMASLDASVNVPAESEVILSRSVRFSAPGTNLVSVEADVDRDGIQADNQSHVAVRVASAVPVLLVDGSTGLKRSGSHAFFAQLALSPGQESDPWIRARTVRAADLQADDFNDVAAIILADVTRLSDEAADALRTFVTSGKGALISLGAETTPESFESLYGASGLLPTIRLQRVRSADPDAAVPTTILPYSLEAAWLRRFRERKGASLLMAPFTQWWLLTSRENPAASGETASGETASGETEPATGQGPAVAADAAPATIAQLSSGDPLLLQTRYGDGSILLMTSTLNAEWNSLPTTPDYVPFLHEAVFQMAETGIQVNVDFGQPLVTALPASDETPPDNLLFRAPFDLTEGADITPAADSWTVTLAGTRLPGIHELEQVTGDQTEVVDRFVVNYNHEEDDPAELDANDRARLTSENRMTFVDSVATLRKEMYGSESRSELWAVLMWLFLAFLILEVWMTRRLVRQGHADTEITTAQAA